jgi:hypothetical protein
VGSFNFDNRKMVFESYLLPVMPNHTKSILDYDVQIRNLRPEATFFVPAETGKPKVEKPKSGSDPTIVSYNTSLTILRRAYVMHFVKQKYFIMP